MMNTQTLTNQVTNILNALLTQGVRDAVLAPGSRSTPIALGLAQLARENKINLYVDVDERSAAFFALGISKTTSKPVLLLCTSGTAAANFYPAVCEAFSSHIPLIVLTTDRPPELTRIGAPQALDQNCFYGHQVKKFYQLPLASDNFDECQYTNFIVQRCIIHATSHPFGPVHLNLPLRKPLMPRLPLSFMKTSKKLTRSKIKTSLAATDLADLSAAFSDKRGLIIMGPKEDQTNHNALLRWAENAGWPILADPLSQLRGIDSKNIISAYDILLKTQLPLLNDLKPDVIIRGGGTFVSANLGAWMKRLNVPNYYLDPNYELNDYTETLTNVLPLSVDCFFESCPCPAPRRGWLNKWSQLQKEIKKGLANLNSKNHLDEPAIPQLLEHILPVETHLFISNSMPIRDIDSYFIPQKKFRYLYCNRGANGIDGIISSALGMSSQFKNNLLLIGDLAFFHDMNGLMMAERYHLQLRIIVINNNGGGIFSFLPQAGSTDFETIFGTPQGLEIRQVAQLYHAKYIKTDSTIALADILQQPLHGLEIIEIPTNRTTNVSAHQAILQMITQQLSKEF